MPDAWIVTLPGRGALSQMATHRLTLVRLTVCVYVGHPQYRGRGGFAFSCYPMLSTTPAEALTLEEARQEALRAVWAALGQEAEIIAGHVSARAKTLL
jgi:hypothetical protein